MTVVIKGMDMPKNCTNCPLNIYQMSFGCAVTGRRYNWGNPERLSDCPLVEVPTPHGNLIESKYLWEFAERTTRGHGVGKVPVVIKAEE